MIDDVTFHLAVLTVSLHIPESQSLKDKRMAVRSLKDRIKAKYNVSVAEVGGHDKWQVAVLAVAMIGTDNRLIDNNLQSVLAFVEGFGPVQLCEHRIEFY